MEQICVQVDVNAMPKREFGSGNQDIIYIMIIPIGAELSAIRERGYLAILGDRSQIYLSMIDRRISRESVYMWGFSGPGSAKVSLLHHHQFTT